jgi:hypothetical protein
VRTIEIDFDIHKMIELERKSFDEDANTALRRLLGLPAKATTPEVAAGNLKPAWHDKDGLTLPHGTRLRMTYAGRTYEGVIDEGAWIVEGERHHSPSGAAGVARTKTGGRTNLNGWNYWEVQLPGTEKWTKIMEVPKKLDIREAR